MGNDKQPDDQPALIWQPVSKMGGILKSDSQPTQSFFAEVALHEALFVDF